MPSALLIFTAVQFEADAIAAALGFERPGPRQIVQGTAGHMTVYLMVIGIGAKRLPSEPPDSTGWIILAGLAGALDPALQVSDVVAEGLSPDLCRCSGARMGKIHTASRIVSTPEQKATIFRDHGAAAVDMESDLVRDWAARHEIHYVGVRAISDRADQTIEPSVLAMIDEWGRTRTWAIATLLLKKPWLILHLVRLGRHSMRAARRLGKTVRLLVEQLGASNAIAELRD